MSSLRSTNRSHTSNSTNVPPSLPVQLALMKIESPFAAKESDGSEVLDEAEYLTEESCEAVAPAGLGKDGLGRYEVVVEMRHEEVCERARLG